MSEPGEKPMARLVTDALRHLSNLLRGEIALVRAEAEEKLRRAARGLVLIAVAAILAMVTLGLVAAGAVLGLIDAGLSPVAAIFLCAAVAGAFGLIAGLVGFRSLTPQGFVPDRSVRNLKSDAHTFKEIIRHEQAS